MGFEPVYDTFRWSGCLLGTADGSVKAVTDNLLPAILAYDATVFPAERDAFFKPWLAPPRFAKVLHRDGEMRGYAVCRKCHDGYKIGPLFAESVNDAKLLLQACSVDAAGDTLHIDVPAGQAQFSIWLAECGYTKGFTTTRMYRGKAPPIRMPSVFGITTLELG